MRDWEEERTKGNSRLGLYMGHAANKAHFFYCTESVPAHLSLREVITLEGIAYFSKCNTCLIFVPKWSKYSNSVELI